MADGEADVFAVTVWLLTADSAGDIGSLVRIGPVVTYADNTCSDENECLHRYHSSGRERGREAAADGSGCHSAWCFIH